MQNEEGKEKWVDSEAKEHEEWGVRARRVDLFLRCAQGLVPSDEGRW